MNNLKIFEKEEFGQVRIALIEAKPYAVGNDIAEMLMYKRPYEAVAAHCKGAVDYRVPTNGGNQIMKVIPEGDIYRLIVKAADQSKNMDIKNKAEKFESWIFDEVLPQIRKTGQYKLKQPQSVEDLIILQAKSVKELKQKVDKQGEQIETIKSAVIHTDEDWRNWVNEQLNKIAFQNKNYRELRKQSYDILENRARCRLNVRLNNLRDRLRETGATETKISQANYLDVIEDSTRLKEIYTNIVEKIVIKYSA